MNSLKDLTEPEISVLDEKILELQKIRKSFYGEGSEHNDGFYEIIYIAIANLKSFYEYHVTNQRKNPRDEGKE